MTGHSVTYENEMSWNPWGSQWPWHPACPVQVSAGSHRRLSMPAELGGGILWAMICADKLNEHSRFWERSQNPQI